jgi:hypothetical protein
MALLVRIKSMLLNLSINRLRSATIVETLVASVIIVVVFSMASLILNNTFKNKILSNTSDIENYANKLFYLTQHNRIKMPYSESYSGWQLTMTKDRDKLILEAEKRLNDDRTKKFRKSIIFHSN